ncbi:unnamed protein product [Caenorhabditis auriculariae]|uniref:Uncharacterized protein n=1 Tax=Caenorhabditis auriculariae TaxID=2777116 RepID=A0A8S1H538_9PELO|nr:unnamed protein product [Caenorhabditis auriculariae]
MGFAPLLRRARGEKEVLGALESKSISSTTAGGGGGERMEPPKEERQSSDSDGPPPEQRYFRRANCSKMTGCSCSGLRACTSRRPRRRTAYAYYKADKA